MKTNPNDELQEIREKILAILRKLIQWQRCGEFIASCNISMCLQNRAAGWKEKHERQEGEPMQIEVLNEKHNIVAVDMPDRKRNGGICVIYGPYTDTIMINKDAFDPGKIAEVIAAYLDLKVLGGVRSWA